MHVRALVVVGGRSGAPDVLTPLAGVPMLVRAVRGLLAAELVAQVSVLSGRRDVAMACAHLPVDVRAGTVRAALARGPVDMLLLHDAARPLTPPALVDAVVLAAHRGEGPVVPVLPLPDTVKIVDGSGRVRGTPDRAGLRVVQTPHAYPVMARIPGPSDEDPFDFPAGVGTVVGHPLAFAVTSAWELELAELLVEEGDA